MYNLAIGELENWIIYNEINKIIIERLQCTNIKWNRTDWYERLWSHMLTFSSVLVGVSWLSCISSTCLSA